MSRVVFIDHSARMGGAEHYLLDIVRRLDLPSRVILFEEGPFVDALVDVGASVSILAAPTSVTSVTKEAGPIAALRSAPALAGFVRRLAREIADDDVVYLNSQKALVAGAPAAAFAGKPSVWNLHDILTAEHFGSMNRRVAVAIANRLVKRVVANSVATRDALLNAGYGRKPIDIVYNGIDDQTFRPVSMIEREAVRRRIGAPGGIVVGVFGRIARWKGQHILIQALVDLPDVTALIVGGPLFQDDTDYLAELETLASSLGVRDRVVFTGSISDVAVVMPSCDIIAHTSVAAEPFGRVIVEAMLCEVPVIATRAGGAVEIVGDDEFGLLVEPGQPARLVEAIRSIVDSPADAKRRATEAREAARRRYSIEQMVDGVRGAITALHQPAESE